MSRVSCIQHQPKSPLVILHQDYLDICDDDKAAAIILKTLEYWTDVKLAGKKQVIAENKIRASGGKEPIQVDIWIYKTYQDFIEDSLGMLKAYQVKDGLKILIDKGFISKRNNPKYNWDRTLQYQFNIGVVQMAINNHCIGYRQPMEELPVTDGSVTGNLTIPETTTETTPENGAGGNSDKPDILDGMIKYANQETGEENVAEPSAFDKHFGGYRDVVLNIWWEKVGRQAQGQLKDDLIDLSRLDNFDPDKFTEFFEKYIRAGGSPYAFDKIKAGYNSHSPQTRRTKTQTQTFTNKYTGEQETITI